MPLPRDVAEYLARWMAGRPIRPVGDTALWPGTWGRRAAAMLRLDLADADIPYDSAGRVANFHSLRATYATLLAREGLNLQTAQALLRHGDPKLAARTYTKLGITGLRAAVAGLTMPTTVAGGQETAEKTRRPASLVYTPV